MKKATLIFLIAILHHSAIVLSQTFPPLRPEQDACNALLICGNTYTSPAAYQGIGLVNDLAVTPCGSGEGNSMWLRLNIVTGGTIVFSIAPTNPGDDYDFAVVDMTNTTCNNLSSANVVSCNFNNNFAGSNVNGVIGANATGVSSFVLAGVFGSSFCSPINVNAGDVLLIMINNFGDYTTFNPASGFTIDFTGSTATYYGVHPALSSIIPSCNTSQQVTVLLNMNVQCSSIEPGGTDFSVSGGGIIASASSTNCTGPGSLTNSITLNFASPLPSGWYTLSAQTGTDGNTLLDPCNSPLLLPDTLQFYIPPYVPPAFVSLESPACRDIKIKMNSRVRCDAIAKNGSDFSISGSQVSNVIAAYGIGCDSTNFTDSIVLILQPPLQTDGVYTIKAKAGTDGNTLLDSCGLSQLVGDSITLVVNSYDGQVIAMPDAVLCRPDYITLSATNNSLLPSSSVSCGLSAAPCTGNINGAIAGGKDSLSAVNSPFFGAWQDSKSQYLFLASELLAIGLKAGSIKTLQWRVTQKSSAVPYDNFTIKIGCTGLSGISAVFQQNLQTVYSVASYNSVAGWNSFDLQTPYNWDGVSNLIVEVCFDNNGSSFNDVTTHSVTNFSSVVHRYGNNLSGCAITTEGALSTVSNLRPRLRFFICEPPAGPPIYNWTPGSFVSDSTAEQPLAFINSNISYGVKVTDKLGCAHRDSVSIILSEREPKLYPMPDTTICFGEIVKLNASGGINYYWLTDDSSSMSCLDCTNPLVRPKQTQIYSVVISDQYDCADTLSTTVIVDTLPVIVITPNDTTVKYGSEIQLNVSGAYQYSWSPPGAVSHYALVSPYAVITRPITFVVVGIDERGCPNTDSVRINVDYSDPIFIPSAFSPNGDGRNDIFRIGSFSFQRLLEFKVFNRWGQEIFSTTDPNQGWDGTWKGSLQNPGVFQYIIRIAWPDGKIELYKGDVTLVR